MLAFDISSRSTHHARAEVDLRDGAVQEAITMLERPLAFQPGLARAHLTLDSCCASSNAADARDHPESFLRLAPDDPEADTAKEVLS